MQRHRERTATSKPRGKASGGTKPAHFYPPKLRGSKFLLFKPPKASYLLWRPQQTSSKAGHHHYKAKGKTHEADDQESCETVFKKWHLTFTQVQTKIDLVSCLGVPNSETFLKDLATQAIRTYASSSGKDMERRVWECTSVKQHLNTEGNEPSHRPGHELQKVELQKGLLAGRPLRDVISCCNHIFWVDSWDPAISLIRK